MLQVNTIRENKEEIVAKLQKKHLRDAAQIVEQILELDNSRKKIQTQLDTNLSESNSIAAQVGMLFKEGKTQEANVLKEKTVVLKSEATELKQKLADSEKEIEQLLYTVPNTPHQSVPEGKTPEHNTVVFESGAIPTLSSNALPHWELAEKYQLIDFELGVKLTGAGFPVYNNKGAKLQRALINFFLDQAEIAGYNEVQPPILVNEQSGYGTGQLPDKEGQMYFVGLDNFYLVPTAEVPVTNIFRDVILKKEQLPVKYTAYTPCFRREAGSYGKDVRGLNRLHQFDKVEIVQIAAPENSYKILEDMREYVAGLLQKLELPFRTLLLCGGDMSFASAMTYDMEVYSAAQKRWLEVSSISNFETFQTNRLKCRYKEGDKKPVLAHSLNGSALALPRIVAALLENNQTDKGIKIPAALVPYTKFEYIS
jgi:seryl-tRNA synthetase